MKSLNERLAELVLEHGEENDGTAFPVWYIAINGGAVIGRPVMISHGIWFSRKSAKQHLEANQHRYPKTAFVYCDSMHMSHQMKELFRLAKEAQAILKAKEVS